MNDEEYLNNLLIFGTLFYGVLHALVFVLLIYLGFVFYKIHSDDFEVIRKWRKRGTIAFVLFLISLFIVLLI